MSDQNSLTELQEFINLEEYVNFFAIFQSEAVQNCIAQLTRDHYMPGTNRNCMFGTRFFKIHDVVWLVTSIPTNEKINMKNAANDAGLKIEDSLPSVFTDELGIITKHDNVFTLGN